MSSYSRLAAFFSILCLFVVVVVSRGSVAQADEVRDLQQQIDELEKLKKLSQDATTPLESEVKNLESRIAAARAGIVRAKEEVTSLEQDISDRELELATQYEIFLERVRVQYKKSRALNPLLIFLAGSDAANVTKDLAYQSSVKARDDKLIQGLEEVITSLEADTVSLEKKQAQLAALEVQLDEQAAFFRGEINKAKEYQQELSGKIVALSARQQEILSARSGSFTASIGDSELADDYNASIKGFRESAPAGYFAVFSFGAYTHRKGMSQYGARGRAQAGQNYKQILQAYYGKEPVNKDTGGNIRVAGQGEINFEEKYLWGIAEMPSSWDLEALKAQAVAARTYAYRYKVADKEICTTEACQVFSLSKSNNPPEAWKQAVAQTRGEVLEDVVTFYASTHGAFTTTAGWDTTDGSGGGNFIDKSYEKIGGSPWLLKAWYTAGYSVNSDKCGRNNPWLSPEEMADIINAARYRDDRVTPVTTSCWGGNPYSHAELRERANGPSSVSSVSVIQGNGVTNEVVFQTNIGEIRLSGSDFKTAFNVRAPGRLSIPQKGFAFFTVERR
ncbi:MAG: hypothetical protein GW946_00755 [Candidatus Pacebacteria bacterium]|nr:hypothetical protein [Candidatus Paceibacterota bacterium]